MLSPHKLSKSIILASKSPRRIEILNKLQISYSVHPSSFDEDLNKSEYAHAKDYVSATAKEKAKDVFNSFNDSLIIGADTIVVLDSEILEKPKDEIHAKEMLKSLSGRSHVVITAICIVYKDLMGNICYLENSQETTVTFDDLDDQVIDKYVASGEPMDKAGGYGYQGNACFFIPRIDGCYYNVIGLPTSLLVKMLNTAAMNLSESI